jgi:hypothetical protein
LGFIDFLGLADLLVITDPWTSGVKWDQFSTAMKAAGFDNVKIVVRDDARTLGQTDAQKLAKPGEVVAQVKSNMTDENTVAGDTTPGLTIGKISVLYYQNIVYGLEAKAQEEKLSQAEYKAQFQNLTTNVATHEVGHQLLGGEHSDDPQNLMTPNTQKWMRQEIRGFSPAQQKQIKENIPKLEKKATESEEKK